MSQMSLTTTNWNKQDFLSSCPKEISFGLRQNVACVAKGARVVVLVNFRFVLVRPESYFRNEDFCFRQWKSVK